MTSRPRETKSSNNRFATLVAVISLIGAFSVPSLPTEAGNQQASPTACLGDLEAVLQDLRLRVTRASRSLGEEMGAASILYLVSTHASLPPEELLAAGQPLQEVAAEAMASRLAGLTLSEVRSRIVGGETVEQIILGSGTDPQTSLFRLNYLNAAINQYFYLILKGAPDTDQDGMPNLMEADIDGDGVANWMSNDMDGDGLENGVDVDVDGDGFDNIFDDDVDGDGVINPDDDDIDGDGLLNLVDADSDGDGILNDLDSFAAPGIPNWIDVGLEDRIELPPDSDDDSDSSGGDDDEDSDLEGNEASSG